MRNHETVTQEIEYLKSITCDRCKKEYNDVMEMQEFLDYKNDAGYGSIMGDGNKLRMDLCQYCVKEVLGPYIRVEGNYMWDGRPTHFFAHELPDETIEAIANSKMDPKFDYLNDLLENKDE